MDDKDQNTQVRSTGLNNPIINIVKTHATSSRNSIYTF